MLSAVNGGAPSGQTPTTVNVSPAAPGCSASSTTITCTATVTAGAGTDTFTITSYPQPNAKGTALATGTAQVAAVAGQTVTAPVTLSGTIASVTLLISGTYVVGQAATIPVTVIAKDSSGAQIMGTYAAPIALADGDASGATKLSVTTVADSTAASGVTLSYNGAALSSGAAISASVAGLASSNITSATFTPNADFPLQGGSSYTYAATSSNQYVPAVGTPRPASSTTATDTRTIIAGASFNATNNLFDVHEDQKYSNGSEEIGDSYFAWGAAAAGADLLWYGATGNTTGPGFTQAFTETSTVPSIVDVVPHVAGNTWSPSVANTFHTVQTGLVFDAGTFTQVPGTITADETGNADGTYAFNQLTQSTDMSYTDTFTSVLNPDGTASWKDVDSANGIFVTAVGTPEPAPSGSGMVIPVSTGLTPASPAPAPSPVLGPPTLVPDWYPNGGVIPKQFATDTEVDKGSVTVPASCNLGAGIPNAAEQIDETYWNLDPLGSIYDSLTTYYEAPGIGTSCITITATNDDYDATTGKKFGTYTYNKTMGLTADKLAAARRSAFSQALANAGGALLVQARDTQIQLLQQARRRLLRLRKPLRHS